MRRVTVLLIALAIIALGAPAAPTAAQGKRCFAQTNHCIAGRFLQYWQENGGLPVFGYPITAPVREQNRDTGKTYLTQWFERNRFEAHTENQAPYDVLLGRLGADRLAQLGRDWQAEARDAGPQNGCLWFEQTGRNVCNQDQALGFRSYWQSHGLEFDGRNGTSYEESLALFGLPLTAPRMETNAAGDNVLTQWFERARFEWHPNNPIAFRVLLGLLGNEVRAGNKAPPAGLTVQADIKTFTYVPKTIEIKTGTTVVWTNQDSAIHTVTHGPPANPTGLFDSGVLNQGQTWAYTFRQPGEFAYFCLLHEFMIGTVKVSAP